mgnify:CR=1 FL=1
MPFRKHIMLVGESHTLDPFLAALAASDVIVTQVERVSKVLETAEQVKPDAIVFVLPRYWDDITRFVDMLRQKKDFVDTPILYVGSLIEGEDQRVLHSKGVHTLTLGPLMPQEVVRYILDKLK